MLQWGKLKLLILVSGSVVIYIFFYTQVVILITVNLYCVFGVIENQKNLLSDGWRMNQVELASDYSLYMTANAESY